MENIIVPPKEEYIESWRNILVHVAKWSTVDFDDWMNHNARKLNLDNPESWVYHRVPADTVAGFILSKKIHRRLTNDEYLDLEDRVLRALDDGLGDFSTPQNRDYYAVRLQQVLVSSVVDKTSVVTRSTGLRIEPVKSASSVTRTIIAQPMKFRNMVRREFQQVGGKSA